MELPHELGQYTLLRLLGRGGMAEVYLAKQRGSLGMERQVAVKTILGAAALDSQRDRLLKMFQKEARLAATLSHQNIVHIYDVGEEAGTFYLVMEYVQGKALHEVLRARWLPLELVGLIGREILAGLQYVHELGDAEGKPRGLVHRDISPHNVLLSYDGAIKISDFGIAKATQDPDVTDTSAGPKGKVSYMSPEQAFGMALDCRSDLFSLGIVLFEMLARRRLYGGRERNQLQVLTAARRAQIPDPQQLRPELTDAVAAFLRKALQKNPADRYQSAAEMSLALREALPSSATSGDLGAMLRRLFQTELTQPLLQEADDATASTRAAKHRRPAATRRRRSWLPLGFAALLVAAAIPVLIYALAPEPDGKSDAPTAGQSVAVVAVVDAGAGRDRQPDASRPPVDSRREDPPPPAPSPDASADRSSDRTNGIVRARGWALLSVGSTPWARVYLDGRYLGNTPLSDRRVRAGMRHLRLYCPATGKRHAVKLRLGAGKRVRRVFDLH